MHYGRSHPKNDFYADYKTEADFERHPNPHILSAQAPAQAAPGQPSTGELQAQIQQNEMLFGKIREELTSQLSDNLRKINTEISDIRSKQTMLTTMESRKTEEQK